MYRPRAGFALELPPLTRGILRDSDYGCIVPGITPAHAGEYCKPSRFKSPRTELPPLTRGIQFHSLVARVLSWNYPRSRGEYCQLHRQHAKTRNYPRSRGEYRFHPRKSLRPRNYPRSRGEYEAASPGAIESIELPPFTRGIQSGVLNTTNDFGITPAHAGNTAPCPFSFPAYWNYPRSRGEYGLVFSSGSPWMELPPFTRGIRPLKKCHRG